MNILQQLKNTIGGIILGIGVLLIALPVLYDAPVDMFVVTGGIAIIVGAVITFTKLTKPSIILVVALLAVGCAAAAQGGKPDWFKQSELVTDEIARSATSAVPAPVAEMKAGGWLERKNLRERNIRFSKANKSGYLYIMSFGKFVGYYVVKGKISSVNSQMTNDNQVWDAGSGEQGETVVNSIGDDGSFGPNEGGDRGIFFFTSNDVLVETTLDWLYSDAPLTIANVPQLLK